MLMQANFSRCGEPIHTRIHKFDYVFEPNEHGDMVCDVLSEEHVNMMVEMKTFKKYSQPEKTDTKSYPQKSKKKMVETAEDDSE